jgi:hypothetical protein
VRARKKLSNNAARRADVREAEKLAKTRERLSKLEPGGSPERPIEVASASVVEVHARTLRCLQCGYECRVSEHRADLMGERRLRVCEVQCVRCSSKRTVYFRIVSGPQLN